MSGDSKDPKPQIHPAPNGPLIYFTNFAPQKIQGLEGDQGQNYEAPKGTSLCRCGDSENKPFCDGSHGRIISASARKPTATWINAGTTRARAS
jgi:CDGSH-type Zn-finger protein